MYIIGRSMRISRREKVRNEEVKQRNEGSIIDDVKGKQLVWTRVKNERKWIPKQVLKWRLPGKRNERKIKNNMEQHEVQKAINERKIAEKQWNNRPEWQLGIGYRRRMFQLETIYK